MDVMKKILFIIAALVTLAACGDKNNPTPEPVDPVLPPICKEWESLDTDVKIYLSFETEGRIDSGDFSIYQKTRDGGFDLYRGEWKTEGNILSGAYNDGEAWAYSYEFEIYHELINPDIVIVYLKLKATGEDGKESTFVAGTIPDVIKETSDVVVKGHPAAGSPLF